MYIEFNYIKMYIRYEIVPICPYHCVRTILSNTILSIPFCPYHFVRYHFVRSPLILIGTSHLIRSYRCVGNSQVYYSPRAFSVMSPTVWNRLIMGMGVLPKGPSLFPFYQLLFGQA